MKDCVVNFRHLARMGLWGLCWGLLAPFWGPLGPSCGDVRLSKGYVGAMFEAIWLHFGLCWFFAGRSSEDWFWKRPPWWQSRSHLILGVVPGWSLHGGDKFASASADKPASTRGQGGEVIDHARPHSSYAHTIRLLDEWVGSVGEYFPYLI